MFIEKAKYYTKIAMSSSGNLICREKEKHNLIIFRKREEKS